MGRHTCVEIFLWLGVAFALIGAIGVLAFDDAYDRLHYGAPVVLASICIAVATVIQSSFSLISDKAILVAAFLLVTSPILTHATGRAARSAEHGSWEIQPDEEIEVEDP